MRYNELQTPRLEVWLKKLLGIRNGGIVPAVSPEVGVSVDFPSLEDQLSTSGYARWGYCQDVGAVAGQYGYCCVRNGFSSQLVGVQFYCSADVAVNFSLVISEAGYGMTNLLGPNDINWFDTRRLHASVPLGANGLNIASGTNAAVPPGLGGTGFHLGRKVALANTVEQFDTIVVAPGHSVAVASNTVNQGIRVGAVGWVREISYDELNY